MGGTHMGLTPWGDGDTVVGAPRPHPADPRHRVGHRVRNCRSYKKIGEETAGRWGLQGPPH